MHFQLGQEAATELQQLGCNMDASLSVDRDAEMLDSGGNRGGWIIYFFIIGTFMCLTLAAGGWQSNLIVYLIQEYNVKSIDAAQVSNAVNGCTCLFPIIGAIIADSFTGCFPVILISSCISFLGLVLLVLTATLDSLRPPSCDDGLSLCETPSESQFAVLYAGIALASIGLGGTRFTTATMGANQFDKPEEQGIFFNWFFFAMYTTSVISSTAIVYIEDNVSWGLGYGLCALVNLIGLLIFLSGSNFYRRDKPQGSPFVNIVRVLVASIRKRNVLLSSRSEDYHYHNDGEAKMVPETHKKSLSFLNGAALKTEGDLKPDGSIAKPWSLCTFQQVEDLKTVIRIFPLWSSGLFISTPIAIQGSLTALQALTMDRRIVSHFKIPVGSLPVLVLLSTCISLPIIDRFLYPVWQKLTNQSPTPLQRLGIGHVLNIISMVVSALVESRRLKTAHSSTLPMLVMWLFPQLALVGIGEAFHFPGQLQLCYQEFPASLRGTATAMVAMILGIAFYTGTALIGLVRRVTGWLPDDINQGRLDNVYWMVVVIGVLNFGYYLSCAQLYKHQNVSEGVEGSSGSDG
ncbi:hypothetical protein L3X38_031267 [Prunus dulcis]|uniref:Nitrate excretion transporter 1 n=1 Tax=Prunus dulcis TaxID=3755 RepID=A0AAD4YUT2_PRUDU|nr:hypothetical protein L3X38_031267 [Prunus dulcis]